MPECVLAIMNLINTAGFWIVSLNLSFMWVYTMALNKTCFLMIVHSDIRIALSYQVNFTCQSKSEEWWIVQVYLASCICKNYLQSIMQTHYLRWTTVAETYDPDLNTFRHIKQTVRIWTFNRLRGGYIINDVWGCHQSNINYRTVLL